MPEEFSVNNLYDYNAEEFKRTSNFKRVPNKIIGINEWYETPFLKFKLVKNNQPLEIDLQNIVINLRTIDQTVNEIKIYAFHRI